MRSILIPLSSSLNRFIYLWKLLQRSRGSSQFLIIQDTSIVIMRRIVDPFEEHIVQTDRSLQAHSWFTCPEVLSDSYCLWNSFKNSSHCLTWQNITSHNMHIFGGWKLELDENCFATLQICFNFCASPQLQPTFNSNLESMPFWYILCHGRLVQRFSLLSIANGHYAEWEGEVIMRYSDRLRLRSRLQYSS
jgi:hypothetical protein